MLKNNFPLLLFDGQEQGAIVVIVACAKVESLFGLARI